MRTSTIVVLLLEAMMMIGTQGFSSVPPSTVVLRSASCSTTTCSAISVPLDSDWSTPTSARDRIHSVLERAKRRTGRENRHTNQATRATTAKKSAATSTSTSLPFTLPSLSASQRLALEEKDEIVIAQSDMGRQGSGFVVQDIEADEATVWTALLDFQGYERHIHTVRKASAKSAAEYDQPSVTRASFEVSKFHFPIHAVLNYQPEQNLMELSLDNAVQNHYLQSAKGYWYTQPLSTGKTRVWLLCDLTLSPLLPNFVVECAAASAMPRASHWLRPTVAQLQQQQQQQCQ